MRRELFLAAIGVAVLTGSASARPCQLDANDKPIDCPSAEPAQPASPSAAKQGPPAAASTPKAPVNPHTGKPMKPLPRMLTPQVDDPGK